MKASWQVASERCVDKELLTHVFPAHFFRALLATRPLGGRATVVALVHSVRATAHPIISPIVGVGTLGTLFSLMVTLAFWTLAFWGNHDAWTPERRRPDASHGHRHLYTTAYSGAAVVRLGCSKAGQWGRWKDGP